MKTLDYLKESPSQTAGPYVHIGCTPNFCGIKGVFRQDLGAKMVNSKTKGERITILGRVYDGSGTAVKDAMVEIWQADAYGIYPSPKETRGKADENFNGFGRCPVEQKTGEFMFNTIKPGATPFDNTRDQAPHITVWIVARGINIGLHTRLYFEDEDNSKDPVLGKIELKKRVDTLIAKKSREGEYTFNIHLQGHDETVFFDI